jgi:LytS/YehU family sensor histidine kinase
MANELNRNMDTAAIPASQVQAIVEAAVKAALETVGSKPTVDEQVALMEKQAEITAKAHAKLARPENVVHPGISVYSRPGGERDNPKGPCPYKTIRWGGTVDHWDLMTAEECDLFGELAAGSFFCTRPDGTRFKVDVILEKNAATGKVESLNVSFPTYGKLKDGLSSKVAMLKELIAQSRSTASLAGSLG